MESKYITIEDLCRKELDGGDKKYALISDHHDSYEEIFKTEIKYVKSLDQLADEIKILMDQNSLVTKELQPWSTDITDGKTFIDYNKEGYLYYYSNSQECMVKSIKVIDLYKNEYDVLIKKLKIRYLFGSKNYYESDSDDEEMFDRVKNKFDLF